MKNKIRGVFLHIMADALGSVIVILSALIVKYVEPEIDSKWKLYVDPILSIILTIFITASVFPLFKESSLILLQSVPKQIDLNILQTKIKNVTGVAALNNLHLWSLNTDTRVASANVKLAQFDLDLYKSTVKAVKGLFNSHGITNATLEIEFENV